MNYPQRFYQDQLQLHEERLKKLKTRLWYLGFLRLSAFLIAVLCFYFFFSLNETRLLPVGITAVLVFLGGLKKYANVAVEKTLTEKLIFINKNELAIHNGQLNQLDDGKTYDSGKNYFTDLDIFGPRSIFHLLNRTATDIGRDALAARLKKSITNKEHLEQTQQAIKELSNQVANRQLLMAKGLLYNNNQAETEQIKEWLKGEEKILTNKWLNVARWLLPAIAILSLAYWILYGNYLFFLLVAFVNLAHIGWYSKIIQQQHQWIGKKQKVLDQYADMLVCFSGFTIKESVVLKEIQGLSNRAAKEITSLSRISNFFDQRLNVLVFLALNSLLLYDVQCLFLLEKWKQTNKEQFPLWVTALGEIELLNSLATFAFNHPAYVLPEIVDGPPFIEAKNLAHPLIDEKERKGNDFAIGKRDKLHLITGSNMSGKTTFLRAVGVNLLLAQCGAPVCALKFLFSPVQLLSSIRINDSLQEHTSYFMAELQKLQQIVISATTGTASLVLIDEILRGTNSDDKTYGSAQFIKKISSTNSITLFATHDLSLGEIAKHSPGIISNFCFESLIQNGELHFDYRLRSGIAQNKNASFLMEKMGII
jgi:predicted DNA-binding protein YlxM (UPF0122 family)